MKVDVEMLFHLALVVGLECALLGRKKSPVGVVDEMKFEFGVDSVPKFIELLERSDGAIKHTIPALFVDIFGRVARHRSNAHDFMFNGKFGYGLLSMFSPKDLKDKDLGFPNIEDTELTCR